MAIPSTTLQETEKRFAGRADSRRGTERLGALEKDTPVRVAKRLRRLGLPDPKEGRGWETNLELLGLERILGKNDLQNVSYLMAGVIASRTVGRVRIQTASGLTKGYGTGFMVSPRLMMTNNHVLGSPADAASSVIEFNYQEGVDGKRETSYPFDLEPGRFFMTDAALDFALVAVAPVGRDGSRALSSFGWNRLHEEEGKAIVGEYLTIIQHPNGEPKQIAIRENRLIDVLEDFLHYHTDTAPGSSGSPVFNDQWEIVALHHSGVWDADANGNPLTVDGKPWNKSMGEHRIKWIANEGVRISRILAHLRKFANADQIAWVNEMLAAVPPAGEAAIPPASGGPRPGGAAAASGSPHSWTIPLTVSVDLGGGAQKAPSPCGCRDGAVVQPAAPAPPRAVPPPGDADPELAALLENARRNSGRQYYDAARDEADAADYYADIDAGASGAELFRALSALLKETHETKPAYKPASEVYPWVDLHPDRKIRSIYSGKSFDAEELIRLDHEIGRERSRATAELARTEAGIGAEAMLERIAALESSLPYNCEHVVPQSWFLKKEPMRGDLHHLFACESGCNSFRNNYPYYDFTDYLEAVRNECGRVETKNFTDADGARETPGFEPNAGKGTVARATLYFLLRYPHLIDDNAKELKKERIRTLIAWHEDDPPGEYERHRNQAIFERQGNRNPLIDHPDWAASIDFAIGLG